MATLRFLSGWSQEQTGDIRAGEPLRIEYDHGRLPNCRAERYGQPAWSIAAYLRFHPGGQEQSGSLMHEPLEVHVPNDATRVEIWFSNTDQTGCVAWDSRYGQNYWLDTVRE
ncbi:MAG: DUF6209 family protein [Egibacteraceae bacterium]